MPIGSRSGSVQHFPVPTPRYVDSSTLVCERSHILSIGKIRMIKIAAMGDNVVDCYISRREMFPGGNCVNVAIHMSRFGAEAAYIGVVAADAAGSVIQTALRDEGVDTSHLRMEATGKTAYCIIGHRGNNDRYFIRFDLGVSMFEPSAADIQFARRFDAVHIGQSSGLDGWLDAIAPQRLSYDFSTRRDVEHYRRIGPKCFLAAVSGGELSPDEVTATIACLRESGADWVLITRGTKGAVLAGAQGVFHAEATPIVAVDTLGAGDSFIARTLYGLVKGEAPATLLQAASRVAAATCGQYGGTGHAAPIDLGEPIAELQD